MKQVTRLGGMYDVPQDLWLRKRYLQEHLLQLIGSYGYYYVETPILEPTELFLRKAGGELASRMYSFTDTGNNSVSLRPEFTSPIMRHYLDHSHEVLLPARWQYCGPVFRYDENGNGSGQFTQVGAELLGSSGVMSDVELLRLAAEIPSRLEVADFQIKVADLDVVHSILNAVGVSERAAAFIIENVSRLREGRETVPAVMAQARLLNLAAPENGDDPLSRAIDGLDDDQSRTVLKGLLEWSGVDQFGQREPDEVVGRLMSKLRGGDNAAALTHGMELISDLAGINGDPRPSLDALRIVVAEAGADTAAVDRFEEFLQLVLTEPDIARSLKVDLGLVRGLSYYNGLVFEVTYPGSPTPIGGGGRYDSLATALGSEEPVPALGFAYNLETLLQLSHQQWDIAMADRAQCGAFVMAEGPDGYKQACRTASALRGEGVNTELDVCDLDLRRALAYAQSKGIPQVITVGSGGQVTTHDTAQARQEPVVN